MAGVLWEEIRMIIIMVYDWWDNKTRPEHTKDK